MTMTRRKLLSLGGGGVVLALGGGAGIFAATRTPHSALAPWSQAGRHADPRMAALSWAVLAPSAHNVQPWEVALGDGLDLQLWRDPARDLPMTDPHARQLTISMGCFLEAFVIGASATGHGVEIALFPEGEGPEAPVADLRLIPGGATRDPLFAVLPARRSGKVPYADREVTRAEAAPLRPLGLVITEGPGVAHLRDLTIRGFEIEALTPRTWAESIDLVRLGRRAIEADPDGLPVEGVGMELLGMLGLASPEAMKDPGSFAFRSTLDGWRQMLAATPAYIAQVTPGNSRPEQIGAGRDWMRINLTANAAGLSVHPVSQILQEYEEMAELREEVHALFGRATPGTVQMLARLGHAPATGPTPRHGIEARMRGA